MTKLFRLPKVRVQDRKNQYDETLTCIQRDSWDHDIEMNQTDQVDFTVSNDGTIGYQLLENENYIFFSGQQYRIKQTEKDDSGYDIKRTITTTHIRFDAQYVYQYEKHKGSWTVGPADLMSFVFDQNDLGNHGFTWTIIGDPPKVEVTDYGECSGQDCINDCCEKFNMVVTADNKHIFLTVMENFVKKVNSSFRYLYNTPEFQASIDTTEIQNIAKCYGKTKEKEDTTTDSDDSGSDIDNGSNNTSNSDDDATNIDTKDATDDDDTEYYFQPFIVRDEESIKEWGERPGPPISDERFTNPENMWKYALATMKSEPDLQITLNFSGEEKLELGNMLYIAVQPENFVTWVTVTGIKNNVFVRPINAEITLENKRQNLVDYEVALQKSIKSVKGHLSGIGHSLSAVDTLANNAWGMGTITKKVGEVHDRN